MGQASFSKPSRTSSTKSDVNQVRASKDRQFRLYIDIPDMSWPLVYSPEYNISFAGMEKLHPFDAGKWGRVHDLLIKRKLLSAQEFVKPLEASEDELLTVHTKEYLDSLRWSVNVANITEIPPVALLPNFMVQRSVLRKFRLQTGGTMLAGKLAMERGWAINIGGGFHHCAADRGGGFCAYADITLNIHFLWKNFPDLKNILIVDLDAHQGNGYARDFLGYTNVYIMDVYNHMIYPNDTAAKKAIRRKVELSNGTNDSTYLNMVQQNLDRTFKEFSPQYIVYNAGTDILEGDPLGCLNISPKGIIKRDEIVFNAAYQHGIPIIMLTSGGYQRSTAQVIADSITNLHEKKLVTGPKSIMDQSNVLSPS